VFAHVTDDAHGTRHADSRGGDYRDQRGDGSDNKPNGADDSYDGRCERSKEEYDRGQCREDQPESYDKANGLLIRSVQEVSKAFKSICRIPKCRAKGFTNGDSDSFRGCLDSFKREEQAIAQGTGHSSGGTRTVIQLRLEDVELVTKLTDHGSSHTRTIAEDLNELIEVELAASEKL